MGNLAKYAAAGAGAGIAVLAGAELLGLTDGFRVERKAEAVVEDNRIIAITARDFGCFVLVESEVELAGHDRNIVHTWFGSQTTWTDTTRYTARGDSEICLDNEETQVIPNEEAGTLTVIIGDPFSNRPRINHDGSNEGAHSNPSFGERLGTFGNPDNDSLVEGLQVIGQAVIGQNACDAAAIEVFQEQVEEHYQEEAERHGLQEAVISYQNPVTENASVPQGEGVEGDDDEVLGIVIPDHIDIDIEPLECDVTLINGEPVVADATVEPEVAEEAQGN